MTLVAGHAVVCSGGDHQWVPVDVLRRREPREERCRGCGAYGVCMSAAHAVAETDTLTRREVPQRF